MIKLNLDGFNERQKEAILAPIDKPVLALSSPGSGKCITGNSLVLTNKGMIRIDSIPERFQVNDNECNVNVISYGVNGERIPTKTSHWFDMGESQTRIIKTKSGYTIEGTLEHPLLILNDNGDLEYKQLRDISIGDYVPLSIGDNLWGDENIISEDMAYFMGLLIADGCLSSRNGVIYFSNSDDSVINWYKSFVKQKYNKDVKSYRQNKTNGIDHYLCSKSIKKELEELGLKMVTAKDKEIPWSVLQSRKEVVVKFLQGYFDLESNMNESNLEVTSASINLIKQLQIVLLNLGIRSTWSIKKAKGYEQNYYRLYISGLSLRIFKQEIGYVLNTRANNKMNDICSKETNTNIEVFPNQKSKINYLKETYFNQRKGWIEQEHKSAFLKKISRYITGVRNPSASSIEDIISRVDSNDNAAKYLNNIIDNFFFDKVDAIDESCSKVYDFTVPDTHSFVANGFVNHNTRILTYRIAYLISQGVNPRNILAVTFTNKAANEMKERLFQIVGDQAASLWAGTFHGICLRLLRMYATRLGYKQNFTIYDDDDQDKVLKAILKDRQNDMAHNALKSCISKYKMNLVLPEQAIISAENNREKDIAEMYLIYQDKLMEANAMDFDDMINNVVFLMRNEPQIKSRLQEMFQYVLLDETQDINGAQYELVTNLDEKSRRIFATGDESQSIYKFRGANISHILNFQKEYPEAMIVQLEQNYRSSKYIVAAFNELIKNNESKLDKSAWTENPTGEKIVVHQSFSDANEGDWIAERIYNLRHAGHDINDIAVLYRANFQSRSIERSLLDLSIPYQIIGGVSFFQRKEVKDIMAYLRIIANHNDVISINRVINVPRRGIGGTTVDRLVQHASENKIALFDVIKNPGEVKGVGNRKFHLEDFAKMIETASGINSVYQTISFVLEQVGYLDWLEKTDPEDFMDRIENIEELQRMAMKFDEQNEDGSVIEFLQEVSLQSEIDSLDESSPTVKLMTVHSSKGLEFDIVFVCGMEEGIFPHKRSIEENDIEEERRLCYVAISRARKLLHLSHCQVRQSFGGLDEMEPSRFLDEIPTEYMKIE